jgi:hypothetical protein
MGRRTPTSDDKTQTFVAGSFTGVNQASGSAIFWGAFNITLEGTFNADIQLQRSFDGGVNFTPVSKNTSGEPFLLSIPASLTWAEIEQDVLYRLVCTAYTSGTITYRLSK